MATTWPLLLPLLLTFVTTFHFAAASPEASPWPKNYISYDIYKQSVEIFNEAVKQKQLIEGTAVLFSLLGYLKQSPKTSLEHMIPQR